MHRLRPVLPQSTPAETLYRLQLSCSSAAASHIRALLLSTIARLPLTLQGIHGEQEDARNQEHLRADILTAGQSNDAIEQVIMRLSIEDDVSALSWAIVNHGME